MARVHPPDEVARQASFGLESVEGLEGRSGDDAAEIPENGADGGGLAHYSPSSGLAFSASEAEFRQ